MIVLNARNRPIVVLCGLTCILSSWHGLVEGAFTTYHHFATTNTRGPFTAPTTWAPSVPRQSLPRPCSTLTRRFLNLSTFQQTLHQDSFFCLTALVLLSSFGIIIEKKSIVGKALSAPLATMAVALVVANLGIIPFASPVYSIVNRIVVPLAVPLLLFDSDLRRVWRDTGSLLVAFAVGALATVLGTILAYPLIPLRSIGDAGWRVACALAARHIGGAINFVAVAETLEIPGTVVSAAIAADNIVVALYFALLFALATKEINNSAIAEMSVTGSANPTKEYVSDTTVTSTAKQPTPVVEANELEYEWQSNDNAERSRQLITLSSMATALSVACSLVTVGGILTKWVLPPGTSSLPMISALTVAAATAKSRFFATIRPAGTALGILGIQLFFAASGAAASIGLVLQQAPALFGFSTVQIAFHFIILMIIGRGLLKLNRNELYLASNANVGGPTTAAAMAQAKEWKRLVLPALLTGILGYAVATGIALALGPILVRLPIIK